MKKVTPVISWLLVAWICNVFITSLFYKFTGHPDTQHIFSTIGGWLGGFFGTGFGEFFSNYGAYFVGSFELLTAIVLLLPALLWLLSKVGLLTCVCRPIFHSIGGVMAALVMSGAAFFHLVSPLGIEVLHQGKSDGGSLFYAAVSILVSGIILFIINRNRT